MIGYSELRERLHVLLAAERYADAGMLAVAHGRTLLRALLVAENVDAAGLCADLECGHVVPEADVVTNGEDGVELCRECYDGLPESPRG